LVVTAVKNGEQVSITKGRLFGREFKTPVSGASVLPKAPDPKIGIEWEEAEMKRQNFLLAMSDGNQVLPSG